MTYAQYDYSVAQCDIMGFNWWWVESTCNCAPRGSPIIIDISGNGIRLTSAENGAWFDLSGKGQPQLFAWTEKDSNNGFLALDRDENGYIDNGTELFGNFTAQPSSRGPNGFLALAEFDKPESGGNGDGLIDVEDAIYSKLRLWIDRDHDGKSQADELHGLAELNIRSIDLKYQEHTWTDNYGNIFKYRAKVGGLPVGSSGQWAYDVFLQTSNSVPNSSAASAFPH